MSKVDLYFNYSSYHADPGTDKYIPVTLSADLNIQPPISSEVVLASIMEGEFPDGVSIKLIDNGFERTVLEAVVDGKSDREAEFALDAIASRIEELHTDPFRGDSYKTPVNHGYGFGIKHRLQQREFPALDTVRQRYKNKV